MKTLKLLISAMLLAGIATAQQPNTNLQANFINSDPVPLQSGEDGDVTFKLVNSGNIEAENVQVQLLDTYPFEVKPDRKVNYSLGDITPGQEYQISTEVLVAEDAPDGTNSFEARISYGEFSRIVEIPVEVQSQDIELNVANLKTMPQQLMPDTDNNQLSVDVVNNGEKTAENVVLDMQYPEFFQQTSSFSTRHALGSIQAGEVKTATFTFDINETAPAGPTQIDAEINYSPGDSNSEVTEESSFDFYLEGKPQFRTEIVESDLATGSKGQLRVRVTNYGDEQSSSTRIRVMDSADQPFTYGSSSKYIGTLESGKSGVAVFEVETDSGARAKDYLVDFEVRGVRNTEVFVEEESIDFNVSEGESKFRILPIAAGVLVALGLVTYFFRNRIRQMVSRD